MSTLATVVRRRLVARHLKRETGYDPNGAHKVVVPVGPDGRPGERVIAPSRSLHPPRLTPDQAREDFRVFVGNGGSFLGAVCLGRVGERGDPDASVEHTLDSMAGLFGDVDRWDLLPDAVVAGIRARRYRLRFNTATLNEWKFAHAGWLYTAGVLRFWPDREHDVVVAGQRVLDTWTWLSSSHGEPSS